MDPNDQLYLAINSKKFFRKRKFDKKQLFMKKYLIILILIFFIQSWAKADEIRNIEIEGMTLKIVH